MDSLEEMSEQVRTKARNVGRGFIAGAIGGAVASWVMNRYHEIEAQPASVRLAKSSQPIQQQRKQKQQPQSKKKQEDGGEDATVKTAAAISRQLFDHELSQDEKKIAGPAVHYGYGALVGGIYGAIAEVFPGISAGLGIPYATALWFFGDEIAVPALGLSKPPHKIPAEKHASALSSHFVYGITMDIVRRVARRVI